MRRGPAFVNEKGSGCLVEMEGVTLHFGEVPLGDSVELLVLRKGLARQLLPDGKIGVPSSHPYYEVCTSPALYDLVAALIRTQRAAVEATPA